MPYAPTTMKKAKVTSRVVLSAPPSMMKTTPPTIKNAL